MVAKFVQVFFRQGCPCTTMRVQGELSLTFAKAKCKKGRFMFSFIYLLYLKSIFMKNIILILMIICFTFGLAFQAQAALHTIVPAGCTGDANVTGKDGDENVCNLDSVTVMILNVAEIILGLAGSLALLMFVYGGFMYIFAGGKTDLVAKAKSVFTYAVIGLIIILTSGIIMKAVFDALGV